MQSLLYTYVSLLFFLILITIILLILFFRALTNMKLKLKGAQTGHSLLKRKSEALTKRFRGITVKIDEVLLFFFLGFH